MHALKGQLVMTTLFFVIFLVQSKRLCCGSSEDASLDAFKRQQAKRNSPVTSIFSTIYIQEAIDAQGYSQQEATIFQTLIIMLEQRKRGTVHSNVPSLSAVLGQDAKMSAIEGSQKQINRGPTAEKRSIKHNGYSI